MPSKRRTPAKAPASAAPKATPAASKDTLPAPPKATPAPTLPPPPPPPTESAAAKVRREWQQFIVSWYEPEKKKFEQQLQKELTAKYKKLGSSKIQQKARAAELDEKLCNLAKQLAEPARSEWERRLEAAQLREDQWDDMTSEEQQAVMRVFVGFFGDEEDDDDEDDDNQVAVADPVSSEAEECATQDPSGGFTSLPRAKPSPMSTNATFEFVNPTSLFVDGASPPPPSTSLPSLSMDHLATLGTSHAGRPLDPSPQNASAGNAPSFHNWASEAGLVVPQHQLQTSKPGSATLASRPSATDGISRQASAMSTVSSPPLFSNKSSPPQSSPRIQSTKASPSAVNEALPLGKRYIGPTMLDDDEPLDENLLKSKMATEYEEFKHSLRIQMIYDFHMEAADIEIRLVEMLLTDKGTKESRAKAVQEHEMHMMALREQKEEERKRLCAEERERRRQEHRAYLAQAALRSTQGRDVDPSSGRKGAPLKASDKSVPPKGLTVSQKENAPVYPLTASASGTGSKPEPPGILKKSPSAMTEAEASSNEALFAEAAALLAQGRLTADGLVSPQPPQSRRRTNSTRLPDHQIPQITVNLASPPPPTTPSTPAVPTAATKGKKAAKKGQVAAPKPAAISEESDKPGIDAEPPPSVSSWGASISRGVWGNPPTRATEESDPDTGSNIISTFASSLTAAWDTTKKPNSGKKSKTVTFTDDVGGEDEAAPIAPCEPKLPKGTRSAVNGKQAKKTIPVLEEQIPRGPTKVTNGKKPGKASVASTANKRAKAATVSEELEGAEEEEILLSAPPPLSRQTSTTAAWGPVPTGQTKVTTSHQPLRGMEPSRSKSARAETVPEPNVAWGMPRGGDSVDMPGALQDVEDVGVSVESDEDEDWLDKENAEYWNKFIGLDVEKQAAETSSDPAKHVRWMPTVDHDSDEDDLGDDGDGFGGEMWMQYAISGGEIPVLDEPEVIPAQRRPELNAWEQGKTKKGGGPSTDAGKSSSTFEKSTLQGAPWPKIENWLSSTSRVGQSSGSAKFL